MRHQACAGLRSLTWRPCHTPSTTASPASGKAPGDCDTHFFHRCQSFLVDHILRPTGLTHGCIKNYVIRYEVQDHASLFHFSMSSPRTEVQCVATPVTAWDCTCDLHRYIQAIWPTPLLLTCVCHDCLWSLVAGYLQNSRHYVLNGVQHSSVQCWTVLFYSRPVRVTPKLLRLCASDTRAGVAA